MNNDLVGLIASLIPTPRCHFLMTGKCVQTLALSDSVFFSLGMGPCVSMLWVHMLQGVS
jgi:hypothetical protein